MTIQIFGTKKCFDTKKAERYFKERNISVQFIDMKEKGMSKGEFTSVLQAVGGIDSLINENAKDKNTLTLMKYLLDSDRNILDIAMLCGFNNTANFNRAFRKVTGKTPKEMRTKK